jgi:uncharacterized protein (TIGR01777 family)
MEKILIAGGSGLVGSSLAALLADNGYEVRLLVRNRNKSDGKKYFFWNYEERFMEDRALEGVSYIINLSGANIGTHRWTRSYKKEIYSSRIHSTEFLLEKVRSSGIQLKKFICASATGYYGNNPNTDLTESTPPGNNFLAGVCDAWEKAASRFGDAGIPYCIFRMGVVMTSKGGFIQVVSRLIKRGLGAHLGSGRQYISWISMGDLCDLYLLAVENSGITGIYNAVSSTPLHASEIDDILAMHYGKKIWLPNVPAIALKIFLGEQSSIILDSCHASNSRLLLAGYRFMNEDFTSVLKN